MKPTKSKIYCPACEKTKILFDTKSKAENFIRFNAEEIKEKYGYAPCRSYYCRYCLGWHTTHREYRPKHFFEDASLAEAIEAWPAIPVS